MIKLTKLNRAEVVVNSDLIQCLDATPDTVITLINGEKLVVLESVDAIVEKVIAFKRSLLSGIDGRYATSGPIAWTPALRKVEPES